MKQKHRFNAHEASQAELRRKAGILNAYYLPDADNDVLYPTTTPVNTFRIVFNLYFSTNMELLPDRTYAPRDWEHPYDLLDITEVVR